MVVDMPNVDRSIGVDQSAGQHEANAGRVEPVELRIQRQIMCTGVGTLFSPTKKTKH
jgi:hypothetical protein